MLAGLLLGLSGALAILITFGFRTRLPRGVVAALLAVAGAGVGMGGLLLRDDPSTLEAGLVIATLAVLFPLHVHVVVGRLGRQSGR